MVLMRSIDSPDVNDFVHAGSGSQNVAVGQNGANAQKRSFLPE